MMNKNEKKNFWELLKRFSIQNLAWLWLLVGFLLLPFTAWQMVIPLAAWLAPVFLLRFARACRQSRLVAPLIFAAYAGAFLFDLRHAHGDVWAWVFAILMIPIARGLLYLLPYMADRRMGPFLGPWGRWLVFPLAFTSVDWVMSLLKLTTAGSPAYSQYSNLPLIQVLSITGMWGVTFLISWFASTVNALWDHRFHWQSVGGMIAVFVVCILAVFLYGSLRLAIKPMQYTAASVPTVKVAMVTNETIFPALHGINLGTFYRASDAERAAVLPVFEAVNQQMFRRIETALQAGAIIVSTQETAGLVLEEDQAQILLHAADLARQYHAYLEISLWVFTRNQALPYIQNQSLLVDPSGQIAWSYDKTYPVFPGESFIVISGDGNLPVIDTPFGRMSTAICNDLHYPALLRQAGQNHTSILIAPFDDDPTIDTQGPAEAAFRTIENGFSTIRAAGQGLSMITDPEGRVLASQDYFTTSSHILVATLPVHSENTIYSRIGDLFAYLCVAGLFVLVIWSSLHHKQMVSAVRSQPTIL